MTSPAWRIVQKLERQGRLAEIQPALEAREDDVDALDILAMFFRDGLTGPDGTVYIRRSATREHRYYERAAALGDAGAMTVLADRLADEDDLTGAIAMYRRAIRKGFVTAMHNLAFTYLNAGDHTRAVRWFRRAATDRTAPDESALFEVAQAELYGLGTRRDVRAALAKLEHLAESKTSYQPARWLQQNAMILIADIHIHGWLAPRNYNLGVTWLKRASRSGSKLADALLAAW